ncbi:MAG TPA: PEGA domain-containing protein [Spirochaetia bacterium]|nr:PEGA domain-containing protein [Spirochaetia bacterium]
MKTAMRAFLYLAVALGISVGPAFAQGFAPKRIWTLVVTVNAPNAVVYVDNVPAPGGRTMVAGGAHNVKVHADGYFDFNGPVVVNGNTTFPVTLTPQGFPLTIRVAAPGAHVFVDGVEITGTVPMVAPGPHQVQVNAYGFLPYAVTLNVNGPMAFDVAMQPALALQVNVNVPTAIISVDGVPAQGLTAYVTPGPHQLLVHADGYLDWSGMLTVNRNMTFAVRLNPAGFPMTIRVATPGASVFVDNAEVTGTVPSVGPGPHQVRVSAPGFLDYTATVNVTAPFTMDVVLQSASATISFVIPAGFQDPEMRPGDPRGQVRIFIDNRLANPSFQMQNIVVAPGRHVIRVSSGAFSSQLGELVVQPGQSYVVELSLGLNVHAGQQ